ncbi:MAG: hypothetical protein Q9179_008011, partial [Wetmoreana sp. 5 TL-2023]
IQAVGPVLVSRIPKHHPLAQTGVKPLEVGLQSAHLEIHMAKLPLYHHSVDGIPLTVLFVEILQSRHVRLSDELHSAQLPCEDLASLAAIDHHGKRVGANVEAGNHGHDWQAGPARLVTDPNPAEGSPRAQARRSERCRQRSRAARSR